MEIPAQLLPSVAPTGAPGVFRQDRASPASFGALEGEALQRSGSATSQNANEQAADAIAFQKQQNETEVERANIDYDQKRRAVLFDDGGFYTKKGKAAFDAMATTSESIEKMRAEQRQALTNPEQQRAFDVISRRNTSSDLRSMSIHAAQENQVYKVGVAEAAIGNSMAEARAYWNDPLRFAQELGTVKLQTENRAKLMGRTDPEMLKSDIAHYESQMWDARIRAAMLQNPKLADQMYQANADQIRDPALKQNLEHTLKVAVMPVDAKEDAERAMVETPMPAGQVEVSAPGKPSATKTSDKTSRAFFDDTLRNAGEPGTVTPAVQIERDEKRVSLLRAELTSKDNDQNDRKMISQEIRDTEARLVKLRAQPATASDSGMTQASMGGAPQTSRDTKAKLAVWIPAAERYAEQRHPGDIDYRDRVVREVVSRESKVVAMQQGVENQAVDTVRGAIMKTKATSMGDLMSDPNVVQSLSLIPVASMQGLMAMMDHNAREAAGRPAQVNAKLELHAFQRMLLPSDDPNAITRPEQLVPLAAQGLTLESHNRLVEKMEKLKIPGGRAFQMRVDKLMVGAGRMMREGTEGKLMAEFQPEKVEQALLDYRLAFDAKEAEMRKAGKDPASMLVPGNADYFGTYENVKSFLKAPGTTLSDAANKVRAELPEGIPAGSKVIGKTPDGKTVYQSADGKRWVP